MTIAIPASAGTASTYSDLLSEIAIYANRVGDTGFVSVIPGFIRKVEAEMNRRLALKPVRPMLIVQPLTIDDEYVDAPSDLMKPASIQLSDDFELRYTDPTTFSKLIDEDMSQSWLAVNPNSGLRYYTLIDTQFRFYPVPTTSDAATLTYWARLPALTETNTTNWMLTDHPDVYLYGALFHAMRYLRDDEDADRNAGFFDSEFAGVLEAYPSRGNSAPLRGDFPLSNNRYVFT